MLIIDASVCHGSMMNEIYEWRGKWAGQTVAAAWLTEVIKGVTINKIR